MDDPTIERRSANREPTLDLLVLWRPLTGSPRTRAITRRFDRSDLEVARIVDLSLLGAALVAPSRPGMQAGTAVELTVGSGRATAEIVRVEPVAGDAGTSLYGVRFDRLRGAARQALNEHLVRARPLTSGAPVAGP